MTWIWIKYSPCMHPPIYFQVLRSSYYLFFMNVCLFSRLNPDSRLPCLDIHVNGQLCAQSSRYFIIQYTSTDSKITPKGECHSWTTKTKNRLDKLRYQCSSTSHTFCIISILEINFTNIAPYVMLLSDLLLYSNINWSVMVNISCFGNLSAKIWRGQLSYMLRIPSSPRLILVAEGM